MDAATKGPFIPTKAQTNANMIKEIKQRSIFAFASAFARCKWTSRRGPEWSGRPWPWGPGWKDSASDCTASRTTSAHGHFVSCGCCCVCRRSCRGTEVRSPCRLPVVRPSPGTPPPRSACVAPRSPSEPGTI